MRLFFALAAWLALAAPAGAAGLGRLTVLSPLGQPLQAEIEIVSLAPGEEDGLTARLASPDAFAKAGIDLSPSLLGLRISIDRRGGRQPVLRLTTTQPVSEPFLDMLIELQWSTGRLVREYTFLLDPPEYKPRPAAVAAAPAPTPVPAPTPAPVEKPAPQAEEKPAAPAPAAPVETTPIAPAAPPTPAPVAEPAKPAAPATHEVKRGDTLGNIAKQYLPPGVTLNQMLIAIFRANEDAFIRGNVNLVRTGKILNIPDADALGTVDRDEANRLMKEQYAQFNEYRARLAAVPAPADAATGQREVAGRIEPKPEAPKPPAAPSDQVRLSKKEPAKPGAPGSQAAAADDAAARERALKEAQSRQADLEKNVADLQKLLALKNQQLAELEKKGAAKPAPAPEKPAPAPAKPEPVKPMAEAPKPAPTPVPARPEPAKPAAEAPKPAPTPAPAAPAKPEPAKPAVEAPKPKPAAPPPAAKKGPPPPEPSLIDEFLENPLYLAVLGALVLGLVVYGWWTWRRKKKAQAKFQDSVLGAAVAGGAGAAASLAEPTAPPSAGSTTTTVSQTASQAPAGMEAEEVDPIAEADVYMAYGRDAQAEEILKEALQKDSKRTAVHAKLLEIYANRKDAKAFEQTALKLKALTNGEGPDWDKAASLGRSIDPSNGLYAGAGGAEAAPVAAPAAGAAPTLDFDLGGAAQGPAAAPDITLDEPSKEPSAASGVDFDLGSTTQAMPKPTAAAHPADETVMAGNKGSAGLDFNLDLGEEKKPAPAAPAPAVEASGGLDFDLNLGDVDTKAPEKKSEPDADATMKVDLSSISLDLGTSEPAPAAKAGGDPKWQEVATKLDLAKAYEEMGDKDGARELLKEVIKDGDAAQKGSAEQLLAKLG
jgi:pilus assembly protein FimV